MLLFMSTKAYNSFTLEIILLKLIKHHAAYDSLVDGTSCVPIAVLHKLNYSVVIYCFKSAVNYQFRKVFSFPLAGTHGLFQEEDRQGDSKVESRVNQNNSQSSVSCWEYYISRGDCWLAHLMTFLHMSVAFAVLTRAQLRWVEWRSQITGLGVGSG